jgi:hypothetical protein
MNYSYIKTVFPTFENTIAYDKNTFNKLKQPVSSEQTTLDVTGINNDVGVHVGVDTKNSGSEKFYITQEKLLDSPNVYSVTSDTSKWEKEHFSDVAEYTKHTVPSKQIDNLHYYNLPINKEYLYSSKKINSLPSPTQHSYIETFNENASDKSESPVVLQQQPVSSQPQQQLMDGNCTQRYNHVMECNHCKEMLYKTLNLNNKNSYTEEIFELISYCVFAIFILFLLDKIAK